MRDRPVDEAGIAVALTWDGCTTPRVTAKGRDEVARRIVAAAEAAGVTCYPDPELADVLAQIPLGDDVPEPLFRAVAEVIAFAYWVSGKVPEGWPRGPHEGERSVDGVTAE